MIQSLMFYSKFMLYGRPELRKTNHLQKKQFETLIGIHIFCCSENVA